MAKRKPARSSGRTRAAGKASRAAGGAGRRKAARKAPRKAVRQRARKQTRRPSAAKAVAARRGVKAKTLARKRTGAKTAAGSSRKAPRKPEAGSRTPARKSTPPRETLGKRAQGSHRLQIERDRRILEEAVPGPPSSLDLDRHASAARTGRAEMREALAEHTETGPRLTGGDVDADRESAFSTGDEAPGGDMPTPDQDVVEEIGASLGVQYNDDEELKAVDKIEERDRHRWELDPASSDDYRDRNKK